MYDTNIEVNLYMHQWCQFSLDTTSSFLGAISSFGNSSICSFSCIFLFFASWRFSACLTLSISLSSTSQSVQYFAFHFVALVVNMLLQCLTLCLRLLNILLHVTPRTCTSGACVNVELFLLDCFGVAWVDVYAGSLMLGLNVDVDGGSGSEEYVDDDSLLLGLDVTVDGGGGSEEYFSFAPGHFTPLVSFLGWFVVNFFMQSIQKLVFGKWTDFAKICFMYPSVSHTFVVCWTVLNVVGTFL